MNKKTISGFLLFFLILSAAAGISFASRQDDEDRERIHRGPLKIFADQTVSREMGKMIEATGQVRAVYDLENGDRIESHSDFARYDQKTQVGELTGHPNAVWKPKDPQVSETSLTADKITLQVEKEVLLAEGRVRVSQTSSTLKAEEVLFSNPDKQLVAQGGEPEFDVRQDDQHTKIRARKITAMTDRRQIIFSGNVNGTVELRKTSP